MTLETVKKGFDMFGHFVKKNAPTIMAVGGMIGTGVTVYLAIKETPKAMEKIEEKEAIDPEITTLEKAAVAIPEYVPALVAFLITEGLMVGSIKLNLKRIAALGALYSAVVADKETKDKLLKSMEEMIGKEKVEEFKKKAGLETPVEAFAAEKEVSGHAPGYGKNEIRPCVFSLTGQRFKNSYNGLWKGLMKCKVSLGESEADAKAYGADLVDYLPLGEVEYQIKCKQSELGDLLGWKAGDTFDFVISECLIDNVLGYTVTLYSEPQYDYDSAG